MRMFPRIIFILLLSITAALASAYFFWYKPKFKETESPDVSLKTSLDELARLKTHAAVIKKYATAKHLNSRICFLVDMEIASGRNRFFVYDLQKDSVLISGLVAHGSCDNGFQSQPHFSNKANTGCSCQGKFKIGNSYTGKFGLAYKLYGLDPGNSNAYERSIVLHSYQCVPEQETFPVPICNSRGCPMVSPGFLEKLRSYLEKADRSILLGVFN